MNINDFDTLILVATVPATLILGVILSVVFLHYYYNDMWKGKAGEDINTIAVLNRLIREILKIQLSPSKLNQDKSIQNRFLDDLAGIDRNALKREENGVLLDEVLVNCACLAIGDSEEAFENLARVNPELAKMVTTIPQARAETFMKGVDEVWDKNLRLEEILKRAKGRRQQKNIWLIDF